LALAVERTSSAARFRPCSNSGVSLEEADDVPTLVVMLSAEAGDIVMLLARLTEQVGALAHLAFDEGALLRDPRTVLRL
jgi:hypothetical protein